MPECLRAAVSRARRKDDALQLRDRQQRSGDASVPENVRDDILICVPAVPAAASVSSVREIPASAYKTFESGNRFPEKVVGKPAADSQPIEICSGNFQRIDRTELGIGDASGKRLAGLLQPLDRR